MTYLERLAAEKYREERAFRAIMRRERKNFVLFAAVISGYLLGYLTEVISHVFN